MKVQVQVRRKPEILATWKAESEEWQVEAIMGLSDTLVFKNKKGLGIKLSGRAFVQHA